MLRIVGIDSPAVYVEGTPLLSGKRLGILRAMRIAVQWAEPGDIIVQEDHKDHPVTQQDVPDGLIVSFVDWWAGVHMCPRAFQVPDESTRQLLIELWSNETKQSCFGWEPIPKVVHHAVYA